MISHTRTHKAAVLIAAYVMFAYVAALLSVNLTSPTSAALGADWQCSQFALVFTTCSPVRAHETVSTGVRKRAYCECQLKSADSLCEAPFLI
jgi:hypothetical protein